MEITITGKHFNLSDAERQNAIASLNAHFDELPIKIISATVVIDRQANRFSADVVINAKNDLTAKAVVEDFDVGKALDAAILKVDTQITKYLEKHKHHKNGETLVELETKNAEKNAE